MKSSAIPKRFVKTLMIAFLATAVSFLSPFASLSSTARANGDDLVAEAAGDLDTSFGIGGKVAIDFFGIRNNKANAKRRMFGAVQLSRKLGHSSPPARQTDIMLQARPAQHCR